MTQKGVKMFCDKTQFPSLQFCGLQEKQYVVWDLSKNYQMILDPNLQYGTCAIL